MNSKIKVLFVDDNLELVEEAQNFYKNHSDINLIDVALDGIEALEKIELSKPDVMVLDIVMPNLDGFGVMERLAKDKDGPKIVVISALSQDNFLNKAMRLGASSFMVKPFDFSSLTERIKDAANGDVIPPMSQTSASHAAPRTYRNRTLDEKITNIFITVGIPPHIRGYQYLREAVRLAIETPDIIGSITKRLYPSIAEKYTTTSSKVERSIRHAIEVSWNRGKIENINTLFGIRIYSSHDRPTNGEFIALLADKMLLEGA
ncbi:MAG: sporulation transcription factor Spo0A [Firmicutes bacterium]|nr:sporulation transcription factor Spo0A [Bacillota bacterium]